NALFFSMSSSSRSTSQKSAGVNRAISACEDVLFLDMIFRQLHFSGEKARITGLTGFVIEVMDKVKSKKSSAGVCGS
ncbi:MAG TPA: hypothetical protein PLM82_13340, partial [Candidatus Latescibacteria bacterium]|nr:hypothetical protein [Candidatus Latescibacterota bacterium]